MSYVQTYTYKVLCTPLVFAWDKTCVKALGLSIVICTQ